MSKTQGKIGLILAGSAPDELEYEPKGIDLDRDVRWVDPRRIHSQSLGRERPFDRGICMQRLGRALRDLGCLQAHQFVLTFPITRIIDPMTLRLRGRATLPVAHQRVLGRRRRALALRTNQPSADQCADGTLDCAPGQSRRLGN